jgi:hypothetical protein
VKQGITQPGAARAPPWLPFLTEQERAELDAARPDARRYKKWGLVHPARRAAYLAAPDPTGERARTLERLHAAWKTYYRLSRRARSRQGHVEQGPPPPPPPSQRAAAQKQQPPPPPAWLPLLSEHERAQLDAARPGAAAYKKLGFADPQRRAEYLAASDAAAPSERAEMVERLRVAYNTYNRLTRWGRKRRQKLEQGPAGQPPWLALLNEQERAELAAARPDALRYKGLGLADPRRRAEYLAEPDPTGERAALVERLRAALNTYNRLGELGRRRLRNRAKDKAPQPEGVPQADAGSNVLGERDYVMFNAYSSSRARAADRDATQATIPSATLSPATRNAAEKVVCTVCHG